MKPLIPVACLAGGLAGGIAIGWFARPLASPAPAVATTAPVTKPAEPTVTGSSGVAATTTEVTGRATGRPDKPDNERVRKEAEAKMNEEVKKHQAQMTKRLVEVQRRKFEARLAKLAAEAGLSADQQAKIRAAMEERFTKMGDLFDFTSGTSEEKAQRMKDLSAWMKADGLDEVTAGVLTETQKEQYNGFKGKERQNRVEAAALKDLGNLTNAIELTPDQRDDVYQVLADQAAAKEDQAGGGSMMSLFTEGTGIQFDDEFGIQDLMQQQMESQTDGSAASTDTQKTFRETIKQRAEAKVEALRPHLTDAQLQQYRGHVQSKVAGMLNMFGGGDDTEAGQ